MDRIIARDGYAIVRGALPPDVVAGIRREVDGIYARADSGASPPLFPNLGIGVVHFDDLYHDAEGWPFVMDRFGDLIDSGLLDRVREPGENQLNFAMHGSSLRRMRAGDPDNATPFHQDHDPNFRYVIWIALDPCGVDAPGMEFLGVPIDGPLPTAGGEGGRYAALALDEAELWRRFPRDRLVRPVFEPGDAVVFSCDTVHRTHVPDGVSRDRRSLEFRVNRAATVFDEVQINFTTSGTTISRLSRLDTVFTEAPPIDAPAIGLSNPAKLSLDLPIHIFGAGRGGEIVKSALDAVPGARVSDFIDGRKTGTLGGLPIIATGDFLADGRRDHAIVITSQAGAEIARTLRAAGFHRLYDAWPFIVPRL